MKLLEVLLSPGWPWWAKIGAAVLLIGTVAAWWTRDYWLDLHAPDDVSAKRKERPPF